MRTFIAGLVVAVALTAQTYGQTTIQAEDAFLFSSYVRNTYSGYTGTGYVSVVPKTGAWLEFIFRRTSAASDTVTIYYANGGSARNFAITLNDVSVGSVNLPSTGSWTTWSSVNVVVSLLANTNRLRLTTTTNTTTYPVVDRILIGGQAATTMYRLTLTESGGGNVSADPSATYYDGGTDVELTATPFGGNFFSRWMGAGNSPANPYILTMNAHKTIVGVFLDSIATGFVYESSPRAFASMNALGNNGTTGGQNGDVTVVTSGDELWNLMLLRTDVGHVLNLPPLTVYVAGILSPGPVIGSSEMLSIKDAYDISVIGIGDSATITGFGLNINRSVNVIVRNIRFASCPDDGITIQADDDETKGHHIWIDHCTFTMIPPPGYPSQTPSDGALDITHTASYVTISWNHFDRWDKNSLMGHSDTNTEDVAMKVSYHHNYYDSTVQRNPRVRFGKAHVFNNYYRKNHIYGVSSNMEADVVVEGNYFINVAIPTESGRDGGPEGDIIQHNNIFVSCGTPETRGTAFDPSSFYSYTLDSASTIPATVSAYAGAGVYDFSSGSIDSTMWTLTVNSVNGSVAKVPDQPSYLNGTNVQLTATPDGGYTFANWSGDVPPAQSGINPLNVAMNNNKTITANFTNQQCTLVVNAVNGTVAKNPDLTSYPLGSSVQLTATPGGGYVFTGWSGDTSGAANPISVVMNVNKNITANFTSVGSTSQSNGTGGGDWNSASTWQGGIIPSGSQHALILPGDSVSSASSVSCTNLTVQSGGKLAVTGTLTVSGLFTLEANALYYHGASGTFTLPGATRFLDDASTVIYNYTGGSTSIAAGTFGNLVIARASNTNATGVLTINGDLTLNITSGSSGLRGTSGGTSRTNTVQGDVYIYGGTLSCIDAGTGSATGVWNIGGNVLVSGSSNARLSCFSSGGASTVQGIYNIGGDLTIAGGRLQYATNSTTLALGILNLGGDLTVQAGSSITDNASTGPYAVNFTGTGMQNVSLGMNFSMATNIYDTVKAGAHIVFDTQSFTWGSTAGTLGSFVVNGTLHMKDSSSIGGTGGFTLSPGATLMIESPDGISVSGSSGNIKVSGGRTFSSDATYEYRGTAPQATGNGLPSAVEELLINNAAGVLLSVPVTVNGTLELQSGDLNLNGNTITIGSAGLLIETEDDVVTGSSGSIMTTRTLSAPNAGTNIGGLGVGIGSGATLGSTTIARAHATDSGLESIARYFDIAPTNNSGLSATLVFHYNDSELAGNPEGDLSLFRSTDGGASWTPRGGTVDTAAETITLSGIDAFSRWTAAVDLSGPVSVDVPIEQGWNAVSNPVTGAADSVHQLFPSASPAYAFSFDGQSGYEIQYSMPSGRGHWAKFPSVTTETVNGNALLADTIDVANGWNLIGALSFPVDTADVLWIPSGIRASDFFGYSSGYSETSVLEPGRAYWVKVSAAGIIILSSSAPAKATRQAGTKQEQLK